MEQQARQVAELLKTIANPSRLLLLCTLIEGEYSVSELEAKVGGISQSAVSQHLAILRRAGLIDCRKQGQQVIYRLADRRMQAVIAVLHAEYCSAQAGTLTSERK